MAAAAHSRRLFEAQKTALNSARKRSYGALSTQWHDLDVFESLDTVNRDPSLLPRKDNSFRSLLWMMWETPVLLILIGILSALMGAAVSYCIESVTALRLLFLEGSSFLFMIAYVLFSLLSAATANFITQAICPDAVGGGVPEMKAVLAGSVKPVLLSGRLIWAKSIGLILSNMAGLSVGKEGPYVHMSCAIADLLMRLSWFKRVRSNDYKRLEILACACAAGICATIGTPFGGVLFSIEITATAYMIRNLPRSFLAAIAAATVFLVLGVSETWSLFGGTEVKAVKYTTIDLVLFIGVGVVCGAAGVLFNMLAQAISTFRNEFLRSTQPQAVIARRRYILILLVTLVVAPVVYVESSLGFRGSNRTLVDYMFQATELGLNLAIVLYLPYKFLVTAFSVTLPLPVALFIPVFLTGGVLGRIIGEGIRLCGGSHAITTYEPWEFAVIGAAAFSSGVTRAISTAVIVFELSANSHFRMPLGIAVITAYFIGNRFTKNIYEVLIDTSGTPFLPEMPTEAYSIPAAEVMTPVDEIGVLSFDSTYAEARRVLHTVQSEVIPVVQSTLSMVIVGAVLREDIVRAVETLERYQAAALTAPIPLGLSTVSLENLETESASPMVGQPRLELEALELQRQASVRTGPDPFQQQLRFIVFMEGGRRVAPVADASSPRSHMHWADLAISVPLDTSPYQIVDTMQLNKVDIVFRMLKLNQAYVTNSGQLVGIITRRSLRRFIGRREKTPADRCLQLCSALLGCCPLRQSYEEIEADDEEVHR